jgi:ABC-2 type transport system permease protein
MTFPPTKRRPTFSLARFWAVVFKEFVQMRRDRLTFAMTLGIPLLLLILFGYAINADPKHLPAVVLLADNGPQGRTLLNAIQNSSYLDLVRRLDSESEASELLERGEVQFVINIPVNFTHDLLRGDRPVILVEADATDPAATSNAIASLHTLLNTALQNDLKGPSAFLAGTARFCPGAAEGLSADPGCGPTAAASDGPVDLRIHARYNPESITQYNIVPGLMGVVLTMTMTVITGLAITRERERGTMETLLSMPTRPIEVMTGKIVPYILVGYVQALLILSAAYFLFHVPIAGNIWLLFAIVLIFIVANLAVGITFSTLAQNQLQAVQMGYFFFLPSLLLSGFMFPFRGMPHWAQTIGELFPLTHFLRIARGILLKGNGVQDIIPQLWQIVLFIAVAMTVAVKRYRRTLD